MKNPSSARVAPKVHELKSRCTLANRPDPIAQPEGAYVLVAEEMNDNDQARDSPRSQFAKIEVPIRPAELRGG